MDGDTNPNLQPVQFQQPKTPTFETSLRPRVRAPLALSNYTNNSTKQASVWRQPDGGTLPLGKATFGSTFRPFG